MEIFKQKSILFRIGLFICGFWILTAILAPLLPMHNVYEQNPLLAFTPPNSTYWFGTDSLGRDVFSRVIMGSRISISAGLITVVIAFIIGTTFGGIAGYIGGVVDDAMMRFSEMIMSFPPIILAMVIASALGPSIMNSILAMAIIWWPNYARLMRSLVLTLKENEYITAAKALGANSFRILFIEIFLNSLGPLLIMATLDIGNAILVFSGLSFLGLGTQPPTPEWGAMVSDGALYFNYWWIATFPGISIFMVSMGANFVGDGLRDFLDPKLKKQI